MPEKAPFDYLSETDISAAVGMYRNSHLPAVFEYLFDKAINEHIAKFEKIAESDFKGHQAALVKMRDLRGIIKLENPPKPIQNR